MRQFRKIVSGRTGIICAFAALSVLAVLFRHVLLDAAALVLGASVVAFFCAPIASLFEKRFSRNISALLAITAVIGAAALIICLLLPMLLGQFAELAQSLPKTLVQLRRNFENFASEIRHIFPLPESVPSVLNGSHAPALAKGTIRMAGSAADAVYRISLSFVLGYFFLRDRESVLIRLELAFPRAWRKTAVAMGAAVCSELRSYLRGQALIAAAVGALAAILLALCGVGAPLALGSIVGLFNMIPYFGPVIGGIPAVLTALSYSWQRTAMVIGALWLVQQIDGIVISPRIMSGVTGFSPATVLIALFIGSGIAGIAGMLLALPILVTIRTVFRVFVQKYENV